MHSGQINKSSCFSPPGPTPVSPRQIAHVVFVYFVSSLLHQSPTAPPTICLIELKSLI